MNYSQKAVNLCKKYSSFSLKAVAGRDGILSIGYGHLSNDRHPIKSGMTITESQAEQILRDDLSEHATLISKLLAIKATQNQFDALVSFSHSKGLGFLPSSDVMHFTNTKEFNSAAREMKLYVYDIGSIKLPKLVERRNAEASLYLEGASGNTETNNQARIGFDVMIRWMEGKKAQGVTYSMDYRLGPNSYDCSSAVYFALREAGFIPPTTYPGNTDSLFGQLERVGWSQLPLINGNYATQRGDIFIWGIRGNSGGEFGHTGIFIDENMIIHCNASTNVGITINSYDQYWVSAGRPTAAIYRFGGASKPYPGDSSGSKGDSVNPSAGVFYPSMRLPVSGDTDPNSPALDYYEAGQAIVYDSYVFANGYAWISYVAGSGLRRYVAVGPDDGRTDTVWGTGFLNNTPSGSGSNTGSALSGVFYPSMRLPVSGDTDPNSPALAYYEAGQAIIYDSYVFANGYAWISYIAGSGLRRYVAVGPDDGRTDTVWGTGFLNNTPSGSGSNTGSALSGVFYPSMRLPVSGDTDPNSPALAYYEAGQAIIYDSYVFANGYAWISYIAGSGLRRYVAVGPDDGRTDTVWGTGFFDNGGDPGSQAHPNSIGLVPKAGNFVPNRKLPVSADTDPNSAALDYYEAGQSIGYDSYIFENGYAWISYIAGSGLRRYVAVGPDDGRTDTVWGKGFFN
ncbi:peptidoglycan amidohydrolase family protein [Enterococcus faecalis]|uniref:peptidoglycan amidohydrolase family protein n=4 Tax=Enterococcus TaxID=1350 RepID=UPI0009B26A57|nr:peptidoglycan amidohydrolase family protein [Enterococcus faecalis]